MHTVSVQQYELYRRILCLSYTHTRTRGWSTRMLWAGLDVNTVCAPPHKSYFYQSWSARRWRKKFRFHSLCTNLPTDSTSCFTLQSPACLSYPSASSLCRLLDKIKKIRWRTVSMSACASPRSPPSGHCVIVLHYLIDPVGASSHLSVE